MRLVAIGTVAAALMLGVPGVAAAGQQAATPLRFSAIQYDAPGKDTRDNKQLNREWIRIKNTGAKAVQLKGWTLSDKSRHTYRFGAFKLKAHKSVTIHTGKGKNTATHRYMNRGWYIWNNTSDTATLRNATGRKILQVSWGKKPTPPPAPGNDPRFDTCKEAKANGYGPYYQGTDPEYYWYRDNDGDGVVCE
ncbi:hypothetical protein GCM10027589_37490 [Actinocorallia lasiicapitis]